jgi:FkbH-like protein
VECLFPPVRAKGLITDLDGTLWQGILGDAGAAGVAWTLDAHAQPHALYQELLASLAEAGILIAVASKNAPALVEEAFARPDLLLRRTQVFPLAAGWGPKSDSVAQILKAWNIGDHSVVFVDDSPMELGEVGERFPAIECLRFPSGDAAGVLDLIHTLRARFGATEVREEDRLRARSLSASAAFTGERAADTGDFLARLEARLTLEFSTAADDGRALELVNKTNQFNLNGRRFSEAEWRSLFDRPGAFLLTASYQDRFGPLGKIAALAGRSTGDPGEIEIEVDSWVLSCRAFSRQIEFQMLRCLLEKYRASSIGFGFRPTPRNGPLQEFLSRFFPGGPREGRLDLAADNFAAHCPEMFHQVITKNG